MSRPLSKNHELQREKILELAAEKFAQTGYPNTSMATLAIASGASKARFYHYYAGKDAILFDLLDRYTARLVEITDEVDCVCVSRGLSAHAAVAELIRAFLSEYEKSHHCHAALVNDLKYLGELERNLILARQRAIVANFRQKLRAAFPERVSASNQTAITMMVFGMINWTFTWLKPDGELRYSDLAEEVISFLEHGLGGRG
ncbi:TetR/AcrR family transcriptional regulator [Paraburkholderia sp. SIMBA_030]|uniref:TetR/AcrR family transcriptional regulator n=1 Tax=Paraburkholderia sp. SIMBA_030 TaxID=3085773 RepID=UPI00397E8EC7